MLRRDVIYISVLVVVAALLLANLLRPAQPQAFNLPEPAGRNVSISAAGDSAWVIVGNRVYFLSLKTRGELSDRVIRVIDDQQLE